MYNNYYGNFRQPPIMPQMMQQPIQQLMQPPTQEETLYVTNEQAADAYLMAPNSFVRLWDASKNVFYEKRTDAQGRPFPLEKYEYRKVTESPTATENDLTKQFVTREEFDALRAKLEPKQGEKKKKGDEING